MPGRTSARQFKGQSHAISDLQEERSGNLEDEKMILIATDSYHEPVNELSEQTRDYHRALRSLMEELEAVDWLRRQDNVFGKELKESLFTNKPIGH